MGSGEAVSSAKSLIWGLAGVCVPCGYPLFMYIRKVTHVDKKNRREYYTYKLVESVCTEKGPRQRTLLNLGADFELPEERWKELANRIESIVRGREPLFP